MTLQIVDLSGDGNQPSQPDMVAAKNAGVGGAMVKLCGGKSYINPDHASQAAACADAAVPDGDYHFMLEDGHAGTWREEADFFLSLRQRDTPFALDWERDGWTRSDVLNWLEYTSGHQQRASGLYLNQDFAYRYDVAHEPAFAKFWLWLADWTPPADLLAPWYEIGLWQYRSDGSVPGIGPVDQNLFFGSTDDFRNLGKPQAAMLSPVVTERRDWGPGSKGRLIAETVTVCNDDTGAYYEGKVEYRATGVVQLPWRPV